MSSSKFIDEGRGLVIELPEGGQLTADDDDDIDQAEEND